MREDGGRHEFVSTPAHSHAEPMSSGDDSPSHSPLRRRGTRRKEGRGERMRVDWAEPGHVRPLSTPQIREANAASMSSGDESSSHSSPRRRGRKRSPSRSPQHVVESCDRKRRSGMRYICKSCGRVAYSSSMPHGGLCCGQPVEKYSKAPQQHAGTPSSSAAPAHGAAIGRRDETCSGSTASWPSSIVLVDQEAREDEGEEPLEEANMEMLPVNESNVGVSQSSAQNHRHIEEGLGVIPQAVPAEGCAGNRLIHEANDELQEQLFRLIEAALVRPGTGEEEIDMDCLARLMNETDRAEVHENKESEKNGSSENIVIQCYDSAPLIC